MIKLFVTALHTRYEKRRRYLRLIAEIESLGVKDLQELRADSGEMRRDAWHSVYG